MIRKLLLLIAMVLAVPLLAASCGDDKEEGPIRIGVLHVATGPLAGTGIPTTEGTQLYFDQISNEIGGRQIQLIIEDTQGAPDVGLTKARKLVEQDKVHLILGPQSSSVAPAVVPYLISQNVPTIIDQAGTTSLTQEDSDPNIFRTSYTNGQQHLPMGKYAYDNLGYRKIVILAVGYGAGKEMAATFSEVFKAAGGEIVDTIFVPLGTTDVAPYITEVLKYDDEADAVNAILFGPPAIQFVNQVTDFGVRDKMDVFCLGCTLDGLYLPAQGENAVGIISYQNWVYGADLPANRAFIQAYEAATGKTANVAAHAGYVGATAAGEAIKAIKGDVEDKEKLLEALRKVEFDAPHGPFKFDDQQNAVITVWIQQAELIGGEVVNVPLGSISNVDQYWKP